ncbi:MAG: RNA polymerase subunit sigma-24 [Bacteroidia bacterium]|nr:MAG: RNA polymerase subunit sigma-24 [Bacteroidia bacterium]
MLAQRYTEAWLERPEPFIPDVVRLAQEGDVAAFERVYREHEGRVYALCLRLASDRSRAEELMQDVFVKVWETIDTFRGESAFSSWLHRVAVNVALTSFRSERRYRQRVEGVEDPELHDRGSGLPTTGESLDLEKAISRLPQQARIIFVLHDVEGYRHEEIASRLGVTVGTTKAQLHRARRLLREVLQR